ncbi:hypothetical protein BDY19DRAFT_994788 [Irpex rosettiformis]|uniref:Uncharacterized protein n=1 Tax=Irpex rosettiformis TaxID=378272 RepID=A0ACB8U0M9_9APHY|nr:hypothetical protein BDY19DRAFT_994788 [Irpex rosettiformis]
MKVNDQRPIPSPSSSKSVSIRKEDSNGDLRRMLAKARSPKKNGFRPKAFNVTHPKPNLLSKDTSRLSLKYDTSSPVYTKPSSLPSPSPTPQVVKEPLDEFRLCSMKTCNQNVKNLRYKTCEKCREKERKKQKRRKERGLVQKHAGLLRRSWEALPLEERFAGYMQQLRNNGVFSWKNESATSSKRKAEQDQASPLKRPKLLSDPYEYQTAEGLYAALRRALVSDGSVERFDGHFSIVTSNIKVVNVGRVEAEARLLMSVTGIATRTDILPIRVNGDGSKLRLDYVCACTRHCRGKVAVSVEKVEEKFILGEKVTIRIRH